ncbi:MAG: ABC transporter permease subunit [Anaerolineae bacterium]|nr:ABC transporter permease subunit [Anaerolineae bacterium]
MVAIALYVGARLAVNTPDIVRGPTISLSPWALPWFGALSVGRMMAAYVLSLLFALIYGYVAANNRRAEQLLMPLLDVLQSVPILSFLPVVLLGFSAFLSQNVAKELASIVLIFTSQAWNLTFSWYQSLTTVPRELREASRIFRLTPWLRFRKLELPFAAVGLIWNSVMSWAGGWFFLMAAEIFTVGNKDYRLPGLGAYLQEAANQGDLRALAWGLGTLVLIIVLLDQFIWRPLLTWSDRFKLEMVGSEEVPASWFYNVWHTSRLASFVTTVVVRRIVQRLDAAMQHRFSIREGDPSPSSLNRMRYLAWVLFAALLVYGGLRAAEMLFQLPLGQWRAIGLGAIATSARVMAALLIALAWTIPVGVAIGTNPNLSSLLQPVVQVVASIPATALFPFLLLFLMHLPGGLNLAAVTLMLMGTQWYLLFNIIAGAMTIPQDLKYSAALLGLRPWQRWRTLILPALFPFLITGSITATGGAWNASIVAEYTHFGGHIHQTIGLGALIAEATNAGDYHLLLAATLSMILLVVLINRVFWRRLYRLAEERYRLE